MRPHGTANVENQAIVEYSESIIEYAGRASPVPATFSHCRAMSVESSELEMVVARLQGWAWARMRGVAVLTYLALALEDPSVDRCACHIHYEFWVQLQASWAGRTRELLERN